MRWEDDERSWEGERGREREGWRGAGRDIEDRFGERFRSGEGGYRSAPWGERDEWRGAGGYGSGREAWRGGGYGTEDERGGRSWRGETIGPREGRIYAPREGRGGWERGRGEAWSDRERDASAPWRGEYGSGGYGGEYGSRGYGGEYGSAGYGTGGYASGGFGRGEYLSGERGERRAGGFRGPKGFQRSDERIKDDVCERIARSGMRADDVEVEVERGKVTLSGFVTVRDEKWALEDLAENVFGVDEVENALRVRRETERSASATGQGGGAASWSGEKGRGTTSRSGGDTGRGSGTRDTELGSPTEDNPGAIP